MQKDLYSRDNRLCKHTYEVLTFYSLEPAWENKMLQLERNSFTINFKNLMYYSSKVVISSLASLQESLWWTGWTVSLPIEMGVWRQNSSKLEDDQ